MSIPRIVATLISVGIFMAGAVLLRRADSFVRADAEVPSRGLLSGGRSVQVKVSSGADSRAIARQLEQAGVISEADLFGVTSSFLGLANQLAAGDYEFPRGIPVTDAIQRLRLGVYEPSVTLTIPEGKRAEEVAVIVERLGLGTQEEFLTAARAADYPFAVLADRPQGASLEGYLLPDTYFFARSTNARQVVERLLKTLDERFNGELRAAAKAHGLSMHEALIVASIVEREAQLPEERATIAAVYLNRLKDGMKLDADPTVQYALSQQPSSLERFGWWKRDLTLDDLKVASPYNTYAQAGLPPGPICNPGIAAIRAVANPAPVKYIFFVAKGDGGHAFAESFQEHQRNIARYQR